MHVTRRTLILVTLGLAAASAVEMAILYSTAPGGDPTRVYDGTDTRVFALLIGAALALWLPRSRPFAAVTPNARRLLNSVGGASLLGIFAMFWQHQPVRDLPLRGGHGPARPPHRAGHRRHHPSRVPAAVGPRVEPLRWVGERSYAIYLWHYPVIVLTTPLNAPPSAFRAILQIAATLVIAALSWRYIEQPVRHGALGRQWERIRHHDWRCRPCARRVGPGRRRCCSTPRSAPSACSGWSRPRPPTRPPRSPASCPWSHHHRRAPRPRPPARLAHHHAPPRRRPARG